MISNDPKFNLSQLNAYKLMFAIKLSMEKRIKIFLALDFLFLPAINAIVFSKSKFYFAVYEENERKVRYR